MTSRSALHVSLVVLLACKWRVLLEAIGPLLDPPGGNELIAEGVAVLLEHAPRGALESAQPLDVEVEQVFVRQRHSRNILRLAREGTCQPQRRRRRSRVSVGSAPPISAQSSRGGSRGRRHLFQRKSHEEKRVFVNPATVTYLQELGEDEGSVGFG
jgi:hypothetical protein